MILDSPTHETITDQFNELNALWNVQKEGKMADDRFEAFDTRGSVVAEEDKSMLSCFFMNNLS